MPTLRADPEALLAAAHRVRRIADTAASVPAPSVDGLDPAAAAGAQEFSAALAEATTVLAAGVDQLARGLESAASRYARTEQAVGRAIRK